MYKLDKEAKERSECKAMNKRLFSYLAEVETEGKGIDEIIKQIKCDHFLTFLEEARIYEHINNNIQ